MFLWYPTSYQYDGMWCVIANRSWFIRFHRLIRRTSELQNGDNLFCRVLHMILRCCRCAVLVRAFDRQGTVTIHVSLISHYVWITRGSPLQYTLRRFRATWTKQYELTARFFLFEKMLSRPVHETKGLNDNHCLIEFDWVRVRVRMFGLVLLFSYTGCGNHFVEQVLRITRLPSTTLYGKYGAFY